MYKIETEAEADLWEVENLFDLSFAPGREALSSYRLRDEVPPVHDLCLVARDVDDILAGAIRFWPIAVGAEAQAALLLGPVAVHPTRQGEGLGGLLIEESLKKAKALGWERVVLIGDAPYYSRFGFQVNKALKFPPPTNPDRVLNIGLSSGALDGFAGAVRKP